jgi:hypothetical protein
LSRWGKLPTDLDGLTVAQVRQLAHETDRLIDDERKQQAEQQK